MAKSFAQLSPRQAVDSYRSAKSRAQAAPVQPQSVPSQYANMRVFQKLSPQLQAYFNRPQSGNNMADVLRQHAANRATSQTQAIQAKQQAAAQAAAAAAALRNKAPAPVAPPVNQWQVWEATGGA